MIFSQLASIALAPLQLHAPQAPPAARPLRSPTKSELKGNRQHLLWSGANNSNNNIDCSNNHILVTFHTFGVN
ncbi:hypothetical protein AWZ03_006205 [Drosophila navojoa]|uniref:Uncharacterized protein n=1 Tax=Drosophila navojoa TaxID=7232 RepID=A0A484BER8_DRONA|nr:hypothetical protein AWZ03_006205 [Drosophila navojoa]